MAISATQLRQNIYQVLERISETGEPVEVVLKGKKFKLSAIIPKNQRKAKSKGRLTKIKKRAIMKCSPDALVSIDWSKEWKSSI